MQIRMLKAHVLPTSEPVVDGQYVTVDEELGHKLARFGVARPAFRVRAKIDCLIGLRNCLAGEVVETWSEPDANESRYEFETAIKGLKPARFSGNRDTEPGKSMVVSSAEAVEMVMCGAAEFAELPAGLSS